MLDHNIECVLLLQNVFSYYRRRKGPRHFRLVPFAAHLCSITIWVNLWYTEDMSYETKKNMSEFMGYRGHVRICARSQYVWIYGLHRTCQHLCCITMCVNSWYTEDMSHDTISQYEWTYGIFFNHFYFLYHNVSEFMVYRGHVLGDKHEILHTHKK